MKVKASDLLTRPCWAAHQVTVTGAGGRTGKIVLQKLLAQPDKFEARGVVRNAKVRTLQPDSHPLILDT